MRASRLAGVAVAWLLLSALLTGFLFFAGRYALEGAVAEQVRHHLLLTLDEALFAPTQASGNDAQGLQRVGGQLNEALRGLILTRWYSPLRACTARLERIDNVTLEGEALSARPGGSALKFTVLRNELEREVVVGIDCARNVWAPVGIGAVLGLMFAAIGLLLRPPLSRTHRQWINYLLERGYSGDEAFDLVRGYDAARLDLNAAQWAALERLHDAQQRNVAQALAVALDPRVAALGEPAVDWLVLGLRRGAGDLDSALALAQADDALLIDLPAMALTLRGLPVATSGTPLFYYAWYARSRLDGEGWITNPASNRPDRAAAAELVALMNRYEGHARAINDLERTGLKARTLDQNRSKIKEEIVAVLGETLAEAYLFEASRHPDGIHTRYRLRLQADQIRLVDPA